MRRIVVLVAATVVAILAGSLSAARPAAAAFPGGNGAIAYRCDGICEVGADGSGQTQLTSGGGDGWPAWSPDGSLIAFECGGGVCVMDADGSDRRQVASSGWQPAWSPDGTRVAFGCGSSSGDGICVVDADGSDQTQLTNGAEFQPSWSPDGTTIAFDRLRSGSTGGSDIYTMNPDGSGQTQLTNGGESVWNESPDWSPDGTRIVFGSWHGSDGQIWVMNADGSAQTQLTHGGADEYPTWSPDGTLIAFDSDGGIHVMDADGSGVIQLETQGSQPDWQPLTATPGPFSELVLRMAGPRRIGPGDPITYSIRVRNHGPAEAEDVVVTDPLPAGTTFVRAHATHGSCQVPDPASATLSCSLGSIGDGSVRTIIVVCRADSAGVVTNTARVSGSTPDPDVHDNAATVTTTVR
jgi:uncharacterized repeat protein (TIGR01451 family)